MATLKTQINNKHSSQFFALTNGVSFDQRLFHEEVFVQREWLKSIREIEVINDEEFIQIDQGLQQAEELNISGIFPWEISEEDIHMNLERFLTESCGDCAKKIGGVKKVV